MHIQFLQLLRYITQSVGIRVTNKRDKDMTTNDAKLLNASHHIAGKFGEFGIYPFTKLFSHTLSRYLVILYVCGWMC